MPDAGADPGAAPWLERPAVLSQGEELAAIALRAEQIGIPAWRVMVALGIALPRPSAGA